MRTKRELGRMTKYEFCNNDFLENVCKIILFTDSVFENKFGKKKKRIFFNNEVKRLRGSQVVFYSTRSVDFLLLFVEASTPIQKKSLSLCVYIYNKVL